MFRKLKKIIGIKYKWKKPRIRHNKLTKYNWMVGHPEGFEMGKHVDIGAFTYIQAEAVVVIGNHVQIGAHCAIYSVNTIDKVRGMIVIKDYARIGAGTKIFPRLDGKPLIIGKGRKIKANSIITE